MKSTFFYPVARLHKRSIIWLFLIILGTLVTVQSNTTTYSHSLSPIMKNGDSMADFPATDQIVNPVIPQRADPWVYKHTDGYYYFTASVPEYDRIEVRRASTIQELGSATPVVVWEKHASGIMSKHIWAPEIHYIDGKWYIYFAAARVGRPFDHRIYVLETDASNPLEGKWVEKGQVKTNWESFSLDATTFEHNGTRYLVWAQRDLAVRGNSNLYIAAMSNPWTISGTQVELTRPDYDWERIGFWVNEGAAVLKRNGRIFITYSASATDFNYAMGLLTASDSSDLLDPDSWDKSPGPVFQTNEATGQYGPGHNSFTVSSDGGDILIYHARNYKDIKGDPLYDPNRHTRAQTLYWNADGTPNFGIPVPDGPLPYRFRSYSVQTHFVFHDEDRGILSDDLSRVASSQFRVVPGLADPTAISFESVDRPGNYLRHRNGEIWLDENDGSAEFAAGATWWQRPGLADSSLVSFESYSVPDQYIRQQDGLLNLSPVSTSADEADATFLAER
jgi:GH43 family beta-xylosidase